MTHNATFGEGVSEAFNAGGDTYNKKTEQMLDEEKQKEEVKKAVEEVQNE